MGKQATPPRSFNTIRQSQCEKRTKRETKKRFVFFAICAVIALIVLTSLVLLVCSVVDSLTSGDQGNNNPSNVRYQPYTQTAEDLERGELILINKNHEYSFPKNATSLLVDMRDALESASNSDWYGFRSDDTNYLFNKEALDAFHLMMEKYYEVTEDDTLNIYAAYRSERDQATSGSSTEPGYSDHHSGYCISFTEAFSDNENAEWITANCYKYGFVVRYPAKKSSITGVSKYTECFRYVGVAHATYMTEQGLCLEEYVEMLADDHTYDGEHLSVTGADGNSYSIYYVPLSKDPVTTVYVPENFEYTVSGDNDHGFIVTVNLSKPIE